MRETSQHLGPQKGHFILLMNQRSELAVQTKWLEHGLVRDRLLAMPRRGPLRPANACSKKTARGQMFGKVLGADAMVKSGWAPRLGHKANAPFHPAHQRERGGTRLSDWPSPQDRRSLGWWPSDDHGYCDHRAVGECARPRECRVTKPTFGFRGVRPSGCE